MPKAVGGWGEAKNDNNSNNNKVNVKLNDRAYTNCLGTGGHSSKASPEFLDTSQGLATQAGLSENTRVHSFLHSKNPTLALLYSPPNANTGRSLYLF